MKHDIKLESGKLLGYRLTTSHDRDSVNTKQAGNFAPKAKLGAKVGGKGAGIQIGAKIGVVKQP